MSGIFTFIRKLEAWRWSTLAVLLLFVVGAAMLVADRERERLLETSRQHIDAELTLLGIALRKTLLAEEYTTLEEVIVEWGKEHQNGRIVVLNVTTPDGRTVAQYNREEPQRDSAYFTTRTVEYAGKPLMTVETLRDFSDENAAVAQLRWRFGSAALAVVVALWLSIQYIAYLVLRPLHARIEELERAAAPGQVPAAASAVVQAASAPAYPGGSAAAPKTSH